jgi:protein-S-isoprenylcysteine O-methyltransferase Ste14
LPNTGNLEIYEGLVLGVGSGTVAVVAFAVVGLIFCFFKDCTPTPSIMVTIGILLPLIVLAIIWGIPKQSLKTDTT